MLTNIEGRELFALHSTNPTVRGTYHRPCVEAYRTKGHSESRKRVGVLFLNGLYATRSANGDAAVYWASVLAERGYPSFRIDLPGFGDSDGEPPEDWLGYINKGGYASATATSIREIVKRFELSGVVIAGHCAGAVTAIYAAEMSKECRGLVLMDPYFQLPRMGIPKFRQELNLWARQSRVGGAISRMFDCIKQVRLSTYRGRIPENANAALLRSWKTIASTKLPILILRAPSRGATGVKPRVGEFDYVKHICELAGRKHGVEVKVAEGANHSFSNRQGRAAVQNSIELWLDERVCVAERGQCSAVKVTHNEANNESGRLAVTNICMNDK